MFDKFKYLLRDDMLFYALLIVLIAVVSFGLGRLGAQRQNSDTESSAIKIRNASGTGSYFGQLHAHVPVTSANAIASQQQQYVASQNGSRYYLRSCSGASRINDENKVYFSSAQQAEAAGYTPAVRCDGI